MNEELKRIKSKDYTSIDQKLFENLSRAQNLTSTLSHLSDFQRFLMEQISSLNTAQPESKSNIIVKSIAKNFDDLKESLVKVSRLQVRPEKSLVSGLKGQLDSLKEEVKEINSDIKEKIRETSNKNIQTVQSSMNEIIRRYENERKKREQLSRRCEELEAQNRNLKKQNEKLKTIKVNEGEGQLSSNTSFVQNVPTLPHTQQKFRTPLKETDILEKANSNFIGREEGWKITRNQIAGGLNCQAHDRRSSSIKRQTSNHQITRKSHLNCPQERQKQNQMLKNKGVPIEQLKRGKSKQKIKLFSMI